VKKILIISVIGALILAVLYLFPHSKESARQEVVRVGAILPMTGNAANYGELMKRGITIAMDEYASTWKPASPRLEVVIEDSKSDPKDGVSAMQKLLQIDKVSVVMPALSSVVLACAPIAEQNHVVLLNCPANSPKLRGAGEFVFNIAILSDQESEVLADYAYNKMGARSVGIFFVNNESGRGYRDSFASKFSAFGGVVKASEGHEQGTTEFRTIIEKFRAAQVDLVFMTSYYSESALFLKQAKELGYHNKWLSYASVDTPDFLQLAGDAANGLVFSQPGFNAHSDEPLSKEFDGEYRKRYGQDPDFWTAQYYEGTRLMAAAVTSGASSGEQIRAYLRNLKQFTGVTGNIAFDQEGCVTRRVQFKAVRNGAFIYLGK
jgi:branched-chain amino acid transport system substrate-binding protein